MSTIVNLKDYDLVFTSSFLPSGLSGHSYEMIDYFYVCTQAGLKCAILLMDGLTKETLLNTISDKYAFSCEEFAEYVDHTYENYHPKIIMSRNICIVDGSYYVGGCVIYADNAYLLRCSISEFEYFSNSKSIKQTHLLQDFKMYPERFEGHNLKVVDYVKKIMWSKYKQPVPVKTDTALLYLTSSCRALSVDELMFIVNKYSYSKYLVLTDTLDAYDSITDPRVNIKQVPVENIFEQFDDYIYTTTRWQRDCSPRFIVECAAFNKRVIYEINYSCIGIERRKEDIANNLNSLELTQDDMFIDYVKSTI